MKRTILVCAMVLGFVFVANIVFGNFYVIPTRPRIAGIEITSLPYTISSSGFYFITKDLTSTGNGITVNVDNVTIDLMGFSLIGGTGYGIFMDGRDNVEIRNGTVRDFGVWGIVEYSTSGRNHRIIGLRASGNGHSGIFLKGVNHFIKNCTVSENASFGIYAYFGSTVTGNTAYYNQDKGIHAHSYCTVTDNTVYNSQADGIYAGAGCTVRGNSACYNQNNGITTDNGCTLIDNTAYSNTNYGIYAGIGSTVINNTVYENGNTGIYAGNGCTVTGNTTFSNTADGINAGAGCTVRSNSARSNGSYGIYLIGDCLVHANTATSNTTANIHCVGTNCQDVDNCVN